ncbi:hypothetical protein C8R48DRAFT_782244 [Suillus tomentosus]|nr:hypothetical protein C8R48DRAFT_782244 [Suillus tomentosus]
MATSAAPKGEWNMKDDRCSEQSVKVAIAHREFISIDSVGRLWEWQLSELQSAVQFVGAKKITLPLLECLKPRLEEPVVSSVYAATLSVMGTPLRLLERLVSSLIRPILTSSDKEAVATSTTNVARALLSLVHQRHVDILGDAVVKSLRTKRVSTKVTISD